MSCECWPDSFFLIFAKDGNNYGGYNFVSPCQEYIESKTGRKGKEVVNILNKRR